MANLKQEKAIGDVRPTIENIVKGSMSLERKLSMLETILGIIYLSGLIDGVVAAEKIVSGKTDPQD